MPPTSYIPFENHTFYKASIKASALMKLLYTETGFIITLRRHGCFVIQTDHLYSRSISRGLLSASNTPVVVLPKAIEARCNARRSLQAYSAMLVHTNLCGIDIIRNYCPPQACQKLRRCMCIDSNGPLPCEHISDFSVK